MKIQVVNVICCLGVFEGGEKVQSDKWIEVKP